MSAVGGWARIAREMDEESYRQALIHNTRKRARMIGEGTLPAAMRPHGGLAALLGEAR